MERILSNKAVIAALYVLALYPTVKYIIPATLPIAAAIAVASLATGIAKKLGAEKTAVRTLVSSAVALAFYAVISLCLAVAGREIYRQLYLLCADAPAAAQKLCEFILSLPEKLSLRFFPESAEKIAPIISATVKNAASLAVSGAAKLLGKLASSFPSALLFVVVLLAATFFLCADGGKTLEALAEIPVLKKLRSGAFALIEKAARAYILLFFLTFSELFFGFSIIGVKYPFLIALIVALIDILPVLGVGTALIPWALVCFIVGNPRRAVFLLILWAVTLTVRQIAEPKLVSEKLGVSPLLSLASMYAGIKLFGAAGALLAPVAAFIATAFFKRAKEGELP